MVRIENRTSILQRLRDSETGTCNVDAVYVRISSGRTVIGRGSISDDLPEGRRRWTGEGDRYVFTAEPRELRCGCDEYRRNYVCEHTREAAATVNAMLNQSEPAVATAPQVSLDAVQESLSAGEQSADRITQECRHRFAEADDGVRFADDMEAFQRHWDAYKTRAANGDKSITFIQPDNGGALGTSGTRTFGLEIEVDFPDDTPTGYGEYMVRKEYARRLYQAGISQWDYPLPWRGLRTRGGYTEVANRWSAQFDSTVDNVGGARGVEIVSPILRDDPQSWENLDTALSIAKELGATVYEKHGLHVNVGGVDFNHTIENHNHLLRMMKTYEDPIMRMATNPETGQWHRGSGYCLPATIESAGYRSISRARSFNSHHAILSLDGMPSEHEPISSSTRAEFRMTDGTLDVGRVQANTKVAMSVFDAAKRGVGLEEGQELELAGFHRAANLVDGRMPRLTGAAWEADTLPFRKLLDVLCANEADAGQLIELFASSKWQKQR